MSNTPDSTETPKHPVEISVCVPVYNEEENLERVEAEFLNYLKNHINFIPIFFIQFPLYIRNIYPNQILTIR